MNEHLIKLPEGYGLSAFGEIDSTNEEARRIGEAAVAAGSLVQPRWIVAEKQSAGRGRGGRKWEDATGNLLCTLLIDPACAAAQAAELSFVTGLAVADTVDALLGRADARLKWPNDVLLKGAKTSGILLEAAGTGAPQPAWLAIGIGLNLKWFPEGTPYPATCLADHGADASIEQGLSALSAAMHTRIEEWRAGGFAAVRASWLQRAQGLGGEITARLPNETITGQFEGMDENGALLLRPATGGEIRAITAADIFFGAA